MYNVVIVGFGGMGKGHFVQLEKLDNLNVVGIVDIKQEVIDKAKSDGIKVYDTLEDVCTDSNVNIVIVATPNDVHEEICCQLMNAKKHVISEKPVTLSVKSLDNMIKHAKDNSVLFTVNQNRRFDTDYLTIKKLYESRELGDTFHINSSVFGSRGIPGDWRGEKQYGGGMMFDWGVHLLDQILLMVDSEIESIYCQFTNITNDNVDDGFQVDIQHANKVNVTVEVGTCHFIEKPRWYLSGNNGSASIPLWKEEGKKIILESWDNKDTKPIKASSGFTKTMAPRKNDELIVEHDLEFVPGSTTIIYNNLVETIKGNEELIITHESLRNTLRLIEMCFKSAHENRVIKKGEL